MTTDKKPSDFDITVCTVCGSMNVQMQAWVRPNKYIQSGEGNKWLMEMVDLVESDSDSTNWCDDCQEHVDLIDKPVKEIKDELIEQLVQKYIKSFREDCSALASVVKYGLVHAPLEEMSIKQLNDEIKKFTIVD